MGRNANNFDLLRLLAAAQVVATHLAAHLGMSLPAAIHYFPGVPIFFVISGFLVSQSYERTSLAQYTVNRALRIFPALWACLIVSVGIAALYGITVEWPWIAAQATAVQFYNPPYLRELGVGVMNGSLWTIPVELQFYATLPLIYWLLRSTRALVLAIIVGAMINAAYPALEPSFAQKLAGVSLPTYLYMFLIGVLLQQNPGFVRGWLAGYLPHWLALYLLVAVASDVVGLRSSGNLLNPVQALILSLLVVAAAYAKPITLKADLSYGLYLYHMPVINLLLESERPSILAAVSLTATLATLSWFLIERPALKLKRHLVRAPAITA